MPQETDYHAKCISTVFGLQQMPEFDIDETTIITFFDYSAKLQCETNCVNKSFYLSTYLLFWIF